MANPCTWRYSGDEWGTFDTTCGQAFSLTEGTPKDNTYNFCPCCGGPLVEVYPTYCKGCGHQGEPGSPEFCSASCADEYADSQPETEVAK